MTTPTTKELADSIIADVEASIAESVPLLPRTFTRVLAKAIAAVLVTLYKYSDFLGLQLFVQSASFEDTTFLGVTVNPLKFWGRLTGVGDPAPATQAELLVDLQTPNSSGTVAAGVQLIGTSNGFTYVNLTGVTITSTTTQITVRAVADQSGGGGRGSAGNLEAGQAITVANPIPDVLQDATVAGQVVTAADGESADAYRQRILDFFQKQPQGGAASDYELWGEEPAGIINVYPYTSDCPGQVDVYCEATEASSGSPDGIPTPAQLQEVQDSIWLDENGLASRRPLTALATAFSITRIPFEVEVEGLVVDNAVEVQASIETAITEYFLNREPYIIGLTAPPRLDRITRSGISGVVNDIVEANNGIFTTVKLILGAVEIENYTLGIGEKAKAGAISFT